MARAFAQIGTGLWAEPSIRALSRDAQRAYLLVYTQPELSRCGVLPFRLRRLAQLAPDDTPKTLRRALAQLENGRHVIVDEDAEEILVRTYVRHDGLLAQPQVVAAMVQDFDLIESEAIRLAFLAELRRIWDLPQLPDNQRKGLRLALGEHETDRYTDKIGPALAPVMQAAINAGSVPAFDPAHPAGCPLPCSQPAPKAHAGARAPSPAPTPSPAPAAAAGPSDPAGPDTRGGGITDQLLQEHQAEHGELPNLTAGQLRRHITEALALGATEEHVLAALAEWRGRLNAKPGLLPHLIADAARSTPDPIAAALADPELMRVAAGGKP
jgi:hypothetical protein